MKIESTLSQNSENYYPQNVFSFPFFEDARFILSPNRDVLAELAGPENTIVHVNLAAKELNLKNKITVIRVIPQPEEMWRIVPTTGLAIQSPCAFTINLYFDPQNPNTVNSLKSWSGRQIAHEVNHIVRMTKFPLHATLLEALISEGLGVYFEEHWQGKYKGSFWGNIFLQEELESEWKKARNELYSSDFDFGEWFWGRNGKHTKYAGYTLGNALVKKYFETHISKKMSEVVRMSASEIASEIGDAPIHI